MDSPSEKESAETPAPATIIKNIKLNDGMGFRYEHSVVKARIRSVLKVILKVMAITLCIFACCTLFWYEAVIVSQLTPMATLEEMKHVDDLGGEVHLKNFVMVIWVFATYTFFGEMMEILSLNEKIRILESLRHRAKMESILSLIRQKSYFDAHAVDFILRNMDNSLVDTVVDELGAEEMVFQRVHGMNPRKIFEYSRN